MKEVNYSCFLSKILIDLAPIEISIDLAPIGIPIYLAPIGIPIYLASGISE